MGHTAGTTLEWCDQLLATLWTRVGDAGTTAARLDAQLSAEILRHGSEVDAWLVDQGLTVSRQTIAGYAAVLLAAAQRCGRLLPPDPHRYDWTGAEWYLVRLLALCTLAESH
jgi:hypothetical protein